jgi:hypothetical protein
MTREEADAELAKYGPEDLYYAVKYACLHDVEPEWRAALARATARERRQTERVLRTTSSQPQGSGNPAKEGGYRDSPPDPMRSLG